MFAESGAVKLLTISLVYALWERVPFKSKLHKPDD